MTAVVVFSSDFFLQNIKENTYLKEMRTQQYNCKQSLKISKPCRRHLSNYLL